MIINKISLSFVYGSFYSVSLYILTLTIANNSKYYKYSFYAGFIYGTIRAFLE